MNSFLTLLEHIAAVGASLVLAKNPAYAPLIESAFGILAQEMQSILSGNSPGMTQVPTVISALIPTAAQVIANKNPANSGSQTLAAALNPSPAGS